MKKIAIINRSNILSFSISKIAVGLNDYLNTHGYESHLYIAEGSADAHTSLFGSKLDRLAHWSLFCLTGLDGGYSHAATRKLLRALEHDEIDTIYVLMLHSFFINETLFFNFVKRRGIKVIYIMLDEYVFTGKCRFNFGCGKMEAECVGCPDVRKYPACLLKSGPHKAFLRKKHNYAGTDMLFVGPEMALAGARISPLTKDRTLIEADESIDTRRFSPRDTLRLRRELGIAEEKIICVCVAVYDGAPHERKGVPYFIELARRFEHDDRFVFVQVAYMADYPAGLPSNYIAKGFIDDIDSVAEYLSLGDLFVFPSFADTMPNTCIEALSCGTPLLCWKVYGNEMMAPPDIATFVTLGNLDEMAEVVEHLVKKDDARIQQCRSYAVARYDNQQYFNNLMKIGESFK